MTHFQIKRFAEEDDGAVTVDWVVLTAAIVGLAVALIASVLVAVETLGEAISTEVSTQSVGG